MKINPLKFKTLLVFSVLFLTVINLSAQETNKIDKLNFKLGYSRYTDTEFFFDNFLKHDWDDKTPVGNIRLSTNYVINKYIDAGLYFGYSLYKTYIPYVYSIDYVDVSSIMYGVSSNIHFLPFFIKMERSRIDVYASLHYGGIHLFEPEGGINTKKNYTEYGIYGGLAFYPFRHLGFYAEYGYGKYANWRYGLSLKF